MILKFSFIYQICQLAELNPNALFLKVNYDQLKTLCYGLHIHVLPLFRFYRGAEGRLCSFSCTNATVSVFIQINPYYFFVGCFWHFKFWLYCVWFWQVKKFKDALAKHGTERCSLGPAKGLDGKELLKLASIGEISLGSPLPSTMEERVESLENIDLSGAWTKVANQVNVKEEIAALRAWRIALAYWKYKWSKETPFVFLLVLVFELFF